ncbi:MAG: TolC family protein [Methylococcales bacterium]|nr:TolC family protein [Methylococcales bacterium]
MILLDLLAVWRRLSVSAIGGLLSLSLIAMSVSADQDTAPKPVTIGQLLQIVRYESPRYAALLQRIEAARAEVIAAGVLPNPRISYGRYDLVSRVNTMYDGHVQQAVTLEVPVLVSGQRGARVEAAQKYVDAAAADVEAEYANIVHETRLLFVKLLATKEKIAILNETALEMERLAAIIAGREQAGNASSYDVLRIGIEARSVQTRLETARSDLAGTTGDLGILLGMPGWTPEADGNLAVLGVPPDAKKLLAEAEGLNPDIEAARRSEVAADAGLEKARRERWPVPSLQIGSTFTDNPYGNTTFGGVSVEVPIFDRNQGGMARAKAEKRTALLERELAVSRTRVAIERAVDLLVRRQETRIKFEKDVLSKLPDLKLMGESAYRLGKGSLLELLDAYRSRTEMRLTELDLIQAETEAELDALRASGLLLSYI